ncbi:hypothetical protein G5C51_04610 [Streptomyces sp. A7024]|uniref:Uncharacterized protein n=1 Tax=Streptomyces coryli TaxID=1128680 RepID=A0A6G4TUG7_9ACTN|nr:hypothetical protein [Streptomyces coryli]NGN63190.1 hypothetical protein [Streptomyces coryli]
MNNVINFAAGQGATPLAADGFLDWLGNIGTDMTGLILKVGIPGLCVLFVLVVGWRTRAPGPTIAAVLLAAVVWGGAWNLDQLSELAGNDISDYNDEAPRDGDWGGTNNWGK